MRADRGGAEHAGSGDVPNGAGSLANCIAHVNSIAFGDTFGNVDADAFGDTCGCENRDADDGLCRAMYDLRGDRRRGGQALPGGVRMPKLLYAGRLPLCADQQSQLGLRQMPRAGDHAGAYRDTEGDGHCSGYIDRGIGTDIYPISDADARRDADAPAFGTGT